MSKSLSILVVDDGPAMARTLIDILNIKGYSTHMALSGTAALEILRDNSVDIMLTDFKMPDMNGVELYRATRKTYSNLITFLITAYAADDIIQQGMREGITLLTKPLDIDLLLSLILAV
jgi:CheY-like chemotaxis protein